MAMHSRAAAVYHFGFPVESRVAWGMRGSFFPVFVRTLVGTVWEGLSIIQGGYFTAVLLSCIIGKPFMNMHDPIPKSSDITVQQLIGLLIYFFATMPLMSIPPTKVRILYMIKSVALPPVVIGLFIFCMLKGRGHVAGTFASTKHLSGSTLAWAMLSGINSTMGKTASNTVNQVSSLLSIQNVKALLASSPILHDMHVRAVHPSGPNSLPFPLGTRYAPLLVYLEPPPSNRPGT